MIKYIYTLYRFANTTYPNMGTETGFRTGLNLLKLITQLTPTWGRKHTKHRYRIICGLNTTYPNMGTETSLSMFITTLEPNTTYPNMGTETIISPFIFYPPYQHNLPQHGDGNRFRNFDVK